MLFKHAAESIRLTVNLLVRASEFIWTPVSLVIARPFELRFSVPGANETSEESREMNLPLRRRHRMRLGAKEEKVPVARIHFLAYAVLIIHPSVGGIVIYPM